MVKLTDAIKGFVFEGKAYRVVPINMLKVDADYQRRLSLRAVSTNAAEDNYDERAMRCITVSKRKDGYYWIIDGQHRYEMALLRGKTHVVCEIHEGLSKAVEAALFTLLNNMRTVDSSAKFRASYVAGDPKYKNIVQIVMEHGFNVCIKAGRPSTTNNIRSVAALKFIYESYGKDVLSDTLYIIARCYPLVCIEGAVDPVAMEDIFLRGFAYYLDSNKQYDADEVARAMIGQDAIEFKRHVNNENPGVRGKDNMRGFARCVAVKVHNYYTQRRGRTRKAA